MEFYFYFHKFIKFWYLCEHSATDVKCLWIIIRNLKNKKENMKINFKKSFSSKCCLCNKYIFERTVICIRITSSITLLESLYKDNKNQSMSTNRKSFLYHIHVTNRPKKETKHLLINCLYLGHQLNNPARYKESDWVWYKLNYPTILWLRSATSMYAVYDSKRSSITMKYNYQDWS